jgi:hypothetical protein
LIPTGSHLPPTGSQGARAGIVGHSPMLPRQSHILMRNSTIGPHSTTSFGFYNQNTLKAQSGAKLYDVTVQSCFIKEENYDFKSILYEMMI